jgi:hypothetical protein
MDVPDGRERTQDLVQIYSDSGVRTLAVAEIKPERSQA